MADRQCIMCNYVTSDQNLMNRHIVIKHGVSMYSTEQCGVCDQKFYDLDHLLDHAPACLKIKRVPLTPQAENEFVSLVNQMTKPAQVQSGPFPSSGSSATDTFANGETASQLPSNSQSTSMGVKMETNGDSGVPKIISVTSFANQGNLIDQSSTKSEENGVKSEILDQVAMASTNEMDVQQPMDEGNMEQEGESKPVMDRETPESVGRKIQQTGISGNQASDAFESGNGGDLKQNRSMPKEDRVSDRQKEIVESGHEIGTDQAVSNEASGSEVQPSRQSTVAGGLKRRTTKTNGRGSNGPKIITRQLVDQKKPRRATAIGKQGTLKRNIVGKKLGTAGASKLSKALRGSVSKGSNATSEQVMKKRASFSDKRSGRQKKIMEPGRKTIPPHVEARRTCYEKMKEFINNGKLYCQLCSQWVVVEYPGSSNAGVGYVMQAAIRHVTTHIEGWDLFECSTCHIGTKTKKSMYVHVKKCHKVRRAKFIDRSNQYYKELLNKCLVCFDQSKRGEGLEQLATKSMDTEQVTRSTGAGNGSGQEDEKMEEASSSRGIRIKKE